MINYQESLRYYSEWFNCDDKNITKEFCYYYQNKCRFYGDESSKTLLPIGYGKIFSDGLIPESTYWEDIARQFNF